MDLAASYIQNAVKVERVENSLKIRPSCSSNSSGCGPNCNCESVQTNFSCGRHVTVPQDHIGTRPVCKNSTCQLEGPNGPGVADTDLLIYVTTNKCEY